MKTIQVLMRIFLVIGAFTLAGAASLSRTSDYLNGIYRQHFEELIAGRQIRSQLASSSDAAGQERASSLPREVPLEFKTKPPLQLTVAMNDRLVLTCDASGAPMPAVYWLKNGHPIPESPFYRETQEESNNGIVDSEALLPTEGLSKTQSRLVIDCVDGDAEAIYTCVAESVREKIVSSTYVHIDGEIPMNESVCSQRHIMEVLPASIFMWSGTYLEDEHKDATLLCRAAGNPRPFVYWTDENDKPITNRPDLMVLPTGDLFIRNLTWENHMGLYKCKAANEFGTDEAVSFVLPLKSTA